MSLEDTDNAGKLIQMLLAASAAGVYDETTEAWTGPVTPGSLVEFVLTYATPSDTVAAATAAAVATTGSALTAYGYTQAQADAIPVAINALIADTLVLRQLIVALVGVLVSAGIAS
jgi:hypothetical protein